MSHWLNHHVQAIKLVITRMQNNALSTLMICTVIAVAMCIPGIFYLGVDNLSKLTNHMQDETEISLFLKLDVSSEAIAEIGELLAKNTQIKHYRLVTKDEAWQQLKNKAEAGSESNSPIAELNNNPLPDAFFIQAKTSDPFREGNTKFDRFVMVEFADKASAGAAYEHYHTEVAPLLGPVDRDMDTSNNGVLIRRV